MVCMWLRQPAISAMMLRTSIRTATPALSLSRSYLLLQQRHHKFSTTVTSATSSSDASASNETEPISSSNYARKDNAAESKHSSPSDPAQTGTAPTESSPVTQPLPGQMAKLLDLVDTHRKPLIYYEPDTQLFIRTKGREKNNRFEHRKTINPEPAQMHKIVLYNQLRNSLVKKHCIFQKPFRGCILSGVQRLFSIHKATNEYHKPLGKANWVKDDSRLVKTAYDSQIFDRDNTRATLEILPTGQAALLWINMLPMRASGAGGGGFPKHEHVTYHYKWATKSENLPWNALDGYLRLSWNRTIKVPSISPSSRDYKVWPGKTPCPDEEVAKNVLFMHVMPLFMETYGEGGCRAKTLWEDSRRNDNLPVVFAWQQQYIWCIWRNGPHGPLEMQQTGHWIPEVAPGHRNYEAEQELLPPDLRNVDFGIGASLLMNQVNENNK